MVKAKVAKKPIKSTKSAKKPIKAVVQPPDKSRFQTPLLVLAAILAIGAVIFLAFNANSTDEPVNSAGNSADAAIFADQIIEHLGKGECQQIYDQTSEGFHSVITKETWLEQCGVASGVLKGEAEPLEQADSNPEDDVSEFAYKIVATDEETYSVTLELVYRDDTWQLQGINSQVE